MLSLMFARPATAFNSESESFAFGLGGNTKWITFPVFFQYPHNRARKKINTFGF